MSTQHHHNQGPFDPDDPLTGMGIAMVGMALQEAAEEEERQRRARLTPWERAAEDARSQESRRKAWIFVGVALLIFSFLMCVIFPLVARSGALSGY